MNNHQRDLVLVGGGHSHVIALRMLAMGRLPGTRITLVSPDTHSPYSGMLPGLVAGHYDYSDIHIDLQRLCAWAGARFICARVSGLDPEKRQLVIADGRPPLGYDLLSLDIGSEPDLTPLQTDGEASMAPPPVKPIIKPVVTPVKPISAFYAQWRDYCESLQGDSSVSLAVVGGGVGSVEIVLSIGHWLSNHRPDVQVSLQLLTSSTDILGEYGSSARGYARAALADGDIAVLTGARVIGARKHNDSVELDLGESGLRQFDHVFWCTAASAPAWPRAAGLDCDERGFVSVNEHLQSTSHANVFAAGDIASQLDNPRPKAGVYAVRHGPILAHNLAQYCEEQPLKRYRPQSGFLSLLATADGKAIGNWRGVGFTGRWAWRWKDRIDRKFMRQFSDLAPRAMGANAPEEIPMHCGGCGGKLPADMLARVLPQLALEYPDVVPSPLLDDDAARIESRFPSTIVQSIDVLREMVDDPYVMGRIAANHALSDLYAVGATPDSAQAVVHLGYGDERIQERDLRQLMAGALLEFSKVNCQLVGGHSLEGSESAIGFVVNGSVDGGVLPKAGVRSGDHLILTQPLGTGVLYAAHRQLSLDSRYLPAAEAAMLLSNGNAAALAGDFQASAVTDVTGFGLAGHLLEMLRTGDTDASIALGKLPVLPGCLDCFDRGIVSTAQPANSRAATGISNWQEMSGVAGREILFDPQTSGGLLMAIAEGSVEPCLAALCAAGYPAACEIGMVEPGSGMIKLRA